MRNTIALLSLLTFTTTSLAQKFTLSGYIKDADTGESLISATVIRTGSSSGTSANTHGFYSLTLSKDSVKLTYSYVGYQLSVVRLLLTRDTIINVNLKSSTELEEVVISSTKAEAIHESTRMSTFSIPVETIKALPAFMGEVDILKIIQLMPGVQSGNEGSTGLYVRGGGPDQNLMLLDGVPVYNASHLFGFFSVFNADAINHVELTKGGFPARYGGRLSSVIDINMKEGNMKEIKGEGSIGLIASKVTVEGPLIKDKSSFIISARRTYIDLLAQPIIRAKTKGLSIGYYFYDINAKLNYTINQKNRLYLSNYFGNDKAYSKEKQKFDDDTTTYSTRDNSGLKWGNTITAFRWNHVFNPKLFSNITTTYSRYNFEVFHDKKETQVSANTAEEIFYSGYQYHSGIRDWGAKIDFDYLPHPDHFVRFGTNNIWHTFSPGVYSYKSTEQSDTTIGARVTRAYEVSTYVEDDWKVNDRLKLNVGAHLSAFNVDRKWYHSLQPRIAGRFLLMNELALKASYSSMTQFIHLLTNAGIGLPTDLWVSSTARIKPQSANQVAVGLAKTYKRQYEISLEGYYKKMNNLIEYKDGASYLNVEGDWQDKVVTNGHGRSYGLELLLQKKTGSITGWLGYTLSKTTRQFDELNFGKTYPYKYDRRHDISLALTHTWDKRRDFSLVWVYGSGNSITLPGAVYKSITNVSDPRVSYTQPVYYYGDRNSYRMDSYHRLDLSFSWWKDTKWGQRKWTLAIYNVYNHRNPFYVDIVRDPTPFTSKNKFVQYSLFPIIPSVTYSFKF